MVGFIISTKVYDQNLILDQNKFGFLPQNRLPGKNCRGPNIHNCLKAQKSTCVPNLVLLDKSAQLFSYAAGLVERFWSCFQAKFKLRRENFEPDIAWYNVLYNKNRLTKMTDLGIIFLRRKHTIH